MPKLIRLYIVNVAIGFAISVAFVAMLVWLDIANLRHLILGTEMGWIAGAMLVLANGVVFAGAQFAIAVMRMAEDDAGPKRGKPARFATAVPVRAGAKVAAIAPESRAPEARR